MRALGAAMCVGGKDAGAAAMEWAVRALGGKPCMWAVRVLGGAALEWAVRVLGGGQPWSGCISRP